MSGVQRVTVPVTLDIDFGSDQVNINPTETNIVKSYTGFGALENNIYITNRNVSGHYSHSAMLELEIPQSNQVLSLPDIRAHQPDSKEKGIIVYTIIGAGGTGGYVIRDLLRYLQALKQKGDLRHFAVNLIDGDIVEEKNLVRQNFINADLGKFKAEVLAKRYGTAFGIPVNYKNNFLKHYDEINQLFTNTLREFDFLNRSNQAQHIVVGCVDNHEARRIVYQYMQSADKYYWVDSGNERTSGQVVCGYGRWTRAYRGFQYSDFKEMYGGNSKTFLPTIVDIFPEIKDSTRDLEGSDNTSCAERAMVEDQNIFINMTAAINVLNYLRQITNDEVITGNAVYFDIKGLSKVDLITPEYLAKIGEKNA